MPGSTGRVVNCDAWNPPQVMLDWFELTEPPAPCVVLGPDGEGLFTVNWRAMVTPGEYGSLVCHYSKKWEYQSPD